MEGVNDWSTSSLQTLLNSGDYYNSIGDYQAIGFSEKSKEKIVPVTWNLGGSVLNETNTGQQFYDFERSDNVEDGHAKEWTGEIGLLYSSDYGFATSGGNQFDRTKCLSTPLRKWGETDCSDHNWISSLTYGCVWTLTPRTDHSTQVYIVMPEELGYEDIYSYPCRVLPTLYLNSNIEFVSGSGTLDDPYVLK